MLKCPNILYNPPKITRKEWYIFGFTGGSSYQKESGAAKDPPERWKPLKRNGKATFEFDQSKKINKSVKALKI